MSATTVVYLSRWCGYCGAAVRLLEGKGIELEERVVDGDGALRAEMVARGGGHTVPQIFIGDVHVGGYDDLRRLNESGELDRILAEANQSR